MKYIVEHHSIEISKFDRRYKQFDETDEMVRDIISEDTDSRDWDYETYDSLEEARKKASEYSWRYVSGNAFRYLLIEYDVILECDEDKVFNNSFGVYQINV